MRRQIMMAWTLSLMMGSVCHAEDITIRFNGTTAKVEQQAKDSVSVEVNGAHVSVVSTYQTHKLTVLMSGKSEDGQLILKTAGKAKVKMKGLTLTSQEGAPIWLKNKKKVEITAAKGTENTLTIAACNDTANHKAAVIWAKDKVKFSGTGTLNVLAKGDGCKGIRCKDDITIEELTLNVETTGNNLGEDTTRMMGFGGPPANFSFDDLPEEAKAQMEEMRQRFEEMRENGEFPMGGFGGPRGEFNDTTRRGGFMGGFGRPQFEGNDSIQGGFPPQGEGGMMPPGGGFGGKRKYISTAKGIKSLGQVIVNSGNVTVKTSSSGAEGIEGKEGVDFNSGNVHVTAVDDAINANAPIEFDGAYVVAISTTNDAVDANLAGAFFMPFGNQQQHEQQDPAIIITDGTVFAWSQAGAPEEGLDCDFSPIAISGGRVFSVGAGMGDMPSVPTTYTAKQPTALLIGIDISENQPIHLYDPKGKLLDTITVPFSLQRSSSLLSISMFEMGNTYTVKTKNYEKTFTLNENFTIVR